MFRSQTAAIAVWSFTARSETNASAITFAQAETVDDHIVTRAQGNEEDSRVLEGT